MWGTSDTDIDIAPCCYLIGEIARRVSALASVSISAHDASVPAIPIRRKDLCASCNVDQRERMRASAERNLQATARSANAARFADSFEMESEKIDRAPARRDEVIHWSALPSASPWIDRSAHANSLAMPHPGA